MYTRVQEFAKERHAGQKYNNGDYFELHLCKVVEKSHLLFNDEDSPDFISLCIHAAYLHDSIEDGVATYEEIQSFFGKNIADVVALLTRRDRYFKYVEKIKLSGNKAAILVKMADLMANMENSDKNSGRYAKYEFALDYLMR